MIDEQRIEDIEIKIAYQEKTIAELNSIVYAQQEQIAELSETCQRLTARLKEFAEELSVPKNLPGCEKPPHY